MALVKWAIFIAALAAFRGFYATIHSPSKPLLAPDVAAFDFGATTFISSTCFPGAGDVELPHGNTHYYLFGPEQGPRIVLVHGLAAGAMAWKHVATDAALEGYRVLLYDLWGRGFSDAPAARYDGALYVTQLSHLLHKLGWDHDPFTLVGVSMGGAIATLFTYHFGDLVRELILVCPAGLMSQDDFPPIGRVIAALPDPVLMLLQSELLKPAFKSALLSDMVKLESLSKEEPRPRLAEAMSMVAWQADQHPGFFRSVISSIAQFPLGGLADVYERVGRDTGRPVLAVWGDADITVPFMYSRVLKDKIPHVELVVVPDGTHEITVTDGPLVAGAILEFLTRVGASKKL